MSIRVVNLTAIIELSEKLTLPTADLPNKKFSGIPVKFKGLTFLVFNGRKIVSVGGNSAYQVKVAAREFVNSLETTAKIDNFTVKNMVGSLSTKALIALDATYETMKKQEKCIYEPELFAALYVYTKNCLVIIFHTGKVIFTGTKDHRSMVSAWELLKYRIQWKLVN